MSYCHTVKHRPLVFVLIVLLSFVPVFADISDDDLEDIYDEVVEDVEDEKIGFEELDTEELEDFRQNPLDLNSVNRPDLMKLPMLSARLVIEIIRYRVRRGGFREVEELKDVPGMTDGIYKVIRPFLTVYLEEEKEVLRGDFRLTHRLKMPFTDKQIESPSNFHNPEYIFSKLRLFYGNNMEVSFSMKRDAWGKCLNWENFCKYYLVSNYFYAKDYLGFSTFVIGAYKLKFERGLALGSVAKTISSISREKKGVEPYRSSNKNAGFYGIAVQKTLPYMTWAVFFSDKWKTAKLNPDGTVKSVPKSVNFSYTGAENFRNLNNLEDRCFGAYATMPFMNYEVHFTGYREKFGIKIMPEKGDNYIKYKFSGKRNDVFSAGIKTAQGNGKFFLDYAVSIHDAYSSSIDETKKRETGKAVQFASVYSFSYTTFLFGINRFDSDYYNLQITGAKPVEKMFMEMKAKAKKMKIRLKGETYREVNPLKEITTKRFYKSSFQVEYPLMPKFKTLFRYQFQNEDEKLRWYGTSSYSQMREETNKRRVQLTWSPSGDLRLRWRYDVQEQIYIKADGEEFNLWKYSVSQAELKYKFTKSFQILSKITFDKDPGTKRKKFTRLYISPKMKFSKNASISAKYERNLYYHSPEFYNVSYDDYDSEDILKDTSEKFEVKYTFKF